jgi:hypothetical protein
MRSSRDGQSAKRISQLKQRLADLKARLPAHSVPASMVMEMEELEEQLRRLQSEPQQRGE